MKKKTIRIQHRKNTVEVDGQKWVRTESKLGEISSAEWRPARKPVHRLRVDAISINTLQMLLLAELELLLKRERRCARSQNA